MRTKILILASVALAAGALGVAGGRIVSQQPVQTASAQEQQAVEEPDIKNMARKKIGDSCEKVLKRLERGPIDDATLQKVLDRSPRCRSTVLEVASPPQAARVITVQAPAAASSDEVAAVTRQDDDVFEDDDEADDDDDEYSDDDSGFSADSGGDDDHGDDD